VSNIANWLAANGPLAIQPIAHSVALTTFVALLSFCTLLFGELVPKRLALRRAEDVARFAAPVMQVFASVTRPLVWLMGVSTPAALFMLRAHKQDEPSVSVDDMEHLLEAGRAEGVREAVEQAGAAEAVRLGERTVRNIMRPQNDLDARDIDTTGDQVWETIAMAGYSR